MRELTQNELASIQGGVVYHGPTDREPDVYAPNYGMFGRLALGMFLF